MRGGALLELWKGKGVIHECSNSRGITTQVLSTEDLSAYWRSSVLPPLEAFVGDYAFGGIGGRGTDFMAHLAKCHWH